MLTILSDPNINSLSDVGGSMSRGNIGPKPHLTTTPRVHSLGLLARRVIPLIVRSECMISNSACPHVCKITPREKTKLEKAS